MSTGEGAEGGGLDACSGQLLAADPPDSLRESPPRRRGNLAVAEAEAGDSHSAAGAGEEARRQRSRRGRKVRIGGDERVVEKKMW
jgi:hypothetical protein